MYFGGGRRNAILPVLPGKWRLNGIELDDYTLTAAVLAIAYAAGGITSSTSQRRRPDAASPRCGARNR
ncbi:hypothetical protein KCP78_16305 [Salmonella enterica subsp. enterica]|nr:hypothetical protein KCP78_16305 [Salmonella enterica subsp. enterica]